MLHSLGPLAPPGPAAADHAPGSRWLHDNVRDLDRLLLQCEQDVLRRARPGGQLAAEFRKLALASEAALLATLLDQPLEQVRLLLDQVHRQLAWVIEMNRRSGRSAGTVHDRLNQLKLRLQRLVRSLP